MPGQVHHSKHHLTPKNQMKKDYDTMTGNPWSGRIRHPSDITPPLALH